METVAGLQDVRVSFGHAVSECLAAEPGPDLRLSSPLLGGGPYDFLLSGVEDAEVFEHEHFRILRGGGMMAGVSLLPVGESVEPAAYRTYRALLSCLGGWSLYRVWSFVPRINAEGPDGLESYRAFNVGRWRAFQELYGEAGLEAHLPAASAVGIDENCLSVAFIAGEAPVGYFENPRQVPAYRYPAEHGPKSPSFARGAVVDRDGRRTGYLSGTSSIRGHETVGEGDLDTQFDVTIENIRTVLEPMGFDGALEPGAPVDAQFRVYVRDPADYPRVRDRFAEVVGPDAAARSLFLKADICREPLKLEIEGIFVSDAI